MSMLVMHHTKRGCGLSRVGMKFGRPRICDMAPRPVTYMKHIAENISQYRRGGAAIRRLTVEHNCSRIGLNEPQQDLSLDGDLDTSTSTFHTPRVVYERLDCL